VSSILQRILVDMERSKREQLELRQAVEELQRKVGSGSDVKPSVAPQSPPALARHHEDSASTAAIESDVWLDAVPIEQILAEVLQLGEVQPSPDSTNTTPGPASVASP